MMWCKGPGRARNQETESEEQPITAVTSMNRKMALGWMWPHRNKMFGVSQMKGVGMHLETTVLQTGIGRHIWQSYKTRRLRKEGCNRLMNPNSPHFFILIVRPNETYIHFILESIGSARCICIYIYVHVSLICMQVCVCMYCICMFMCMYIHGCMYVDVYVCVNAYVYVYTYPLLLLLSLRTNPSFVSRY